MALTIENELPTVSPIATASAPQGRKKSVVHAADQYAGHVTKAGLAVATLQLLNHLVTPAQAGTVFIPTGGNEILYASFVGGNRSYELQYTEVITGLRYYCNGRTNDAPKALHENILSRCAAVGTIHQGQLNGTGQLLVASQYNNCGKDYIYTDFIDPNDKLQACIANISSPAGGQSTAAVTSGASSRTEVGSAAAVLVAAAIGFACLFG